MLGIGKLAAGAEDYYLNIAAGIEDYYVGMASPGQWIASSQRLLGLSGEIDPDALRTVFAGLDPATGSPLLQSSNRSVMAFDLTFKADKTVSLLHAFSAPEVGATIEATHRAAVGSALRYIEDHAVRTRRGHNGTDTIRGEGLVAGSFRTTATATTNHTSTSTSSCRTWSQVRTAAGQPSTPVTSTPTPRPPATSTKPSCETSSPDNSASCSTRP